MLTAINKCNSNITTRTHNCVWLQKDPKHNITLYTLTHYNTEATSRTKRAQEHVNKVNKTHLPHNITTRSAVVTIMNTEHV